MPLRSIPLCGRSLRGTARGPVCAQPPPEAAEARALSLGKSANRVLRSRFSREESVRVETAARVRFLIPEALPREPAESVDLEGPRWPRIARWIRRAARKLQ